LPKQYIYGIINGTEKQFSERNSWAQERLAVDSRIARRNWSFSSCV
jgi:hypothetical protein